MDGRPVPALHSPPVEKGTPVWLCFEDGSSFRGLSRSPLPGPVWGEAAFTTGMTGYEETCTDPSFLGQHVVFTTVHVGNYPSDPSRRQSGGVHAASVVVREASPNVLFADLPVPLVTGVDTRALARRLASGGGSHKAVLSSSPSPPGRETFAGAPLACDDLARVSQGGVRVERGGGRPIAVVNYGMKRSILREVLDLGFPVATLPHDAPAREIAGLDPRLVLLSNGPGDPRRHPGLVREVRELLSLGVPLRGVCLGHQFICLALGASVSRLPFGQRGTNHPVFDHGGGRVLITSQNHGYAVDEGSFLGAARDNPAGREFVVLHRSLFDGSVEGVASTDGVVRSVQFHPEASPGPDDARGFFGEIRAFLRGREGAAASGAASAPARPAALVPAPDPRAPRPPPPFRTVLVIWSGPIKIGQASEFDYSGTQACKALRDAGVRTVLLNSNPATIMTDPGMADRTYVEPITRETALGIIDAEGVDAVLSTMGGQTALNLCVELERHGGLSGRGVALLGAGLDTIRRTEDRDLFAGELAAMGYRTSRRHAAAGPREAARLAASEVGFPLIIRRDFALGGKGAVLVRDAAGLDRALEGETGFPITLERSLLGFKEVELEIMVDGEGSGVVVCSIENVDPCGVHTGDSITVAPVQTLSDRCYQRLRSMALALARRVGLVAGGANVQFAINPDDEDDVLVIEMNPRVSRSSALASKATGYPIAKISALLAVGRTLKDIMNDITGASPVAFEPTQDYVSVKIPVFPFAKFPVSGRTLGPAMRSVGEVLAIGGSFTEAFLKALRSLEMGLEVPRLDRLRTTPPSVDRAYLEARLGAPEELSLLAALEGLRLGMTTGEASEASGITPWFVERMAAVARAEREAARGGLEPSSLASMKALGFSDKHVALAAGVPEEDVFRMRRERGIVPAFRAVDTCSGEFDARTPYFYATYAAGRAGQGPRPDEGGPLAPGRSVAILGAGPNRIGQGIEFDYSCVKCAERLRERGTPSVMVNSNPETVSTDYDSSDRLYLSPLYSEDVFEVLLREDPSGVVACFSGQTGIKVRERIEEGFRAAFGSFRFLGSSLTTIHLTEDRRRFAEVAGRVPSLVHNDYRVVAGAKELTNAIAEIGLPVIVRPSYVIGGESMDVLRSAEPGSFPRHLEDGLASGTPFHVERYLENALEYDVDVVRDRFGNVVYAVCEHIEHAGVHSGDSGMVAPPVALGEDVAGTIRGVSVELAAVLGVVGPMNFQYAVKDGRVHCIEANPRGSRTLPFLSKAGGVPLPKVATDAMLGDGIEGRDAVPRGVSAVKQSTFPFDHFLQDSIILGPRMRSTGETFGLDRCVHRAMMKSYLGNYPGLARTGRILFSLADQHKGVVGPFLDDLAALGYTFCATRGTCRSIRAAGHGCASVARLGEPGRTIADAVREDGLVLVVNTPEAQGRSRSDGETIRNTAIQYAVPTFTRPENIRAVLTCLVRTRGRGGKPRHLQGLPSPDDAPLPDADAPDPAVSDPSPDPAAPDGARA